MRSPRAAALGLAAVCAAACTGPGRRPEPPAPVATPTPTAVTPPAPVPTLASPQPPGTTTRLTNGITVLMREAPAGRMATLQFGIGAGGSMMAPGVAELAAAVVADGADPAQGRSSLRQAIAQLGGTLQLQIGPLSTWLDMRVPGARWREALVALRETLQSPNWSRAQITRIRDQLVAERTGQLRREPAAGMARLLLLGERSGTGHLLALLDRDASDVVRFVGHAWQPAQSLLAVEVPADPATVQSELASGGTIGLARWAPPPPAGALSLLDRTFASGLHWCPGRDEAEQRQPCQVAVLFPVSGPGQPASAESLLLLSCLTMDGIGGRLERMQREQGLADVRWQSQVAQTADASALLLTTTVGPHEVATLWRTVVLARQSLLDVSPNESELALAAPRVPLLARLSALDDGARLRTTTMQALTGANFAQVDQRLTFLRQATRLDLAPAAREFLAAPFAMVVIGGTPPEDLAGVQRFDLLPLGSRDAAPAPAAGPTPSPASVPPWLERACDAVGGRDVLRRLSGWQSTSRLVHGEAPEVTETSTWHVDGTLTRTRRVLGQDVETRLAGADASEPLGTDTRPLEANEAARLRRDMQRHPLALLAAFARGELTFRTLAQREVGDRTLVVLEATGGPFDRLRVSIDARSHLVRTVESVETMPDGTVLVVADQWQDYRSTLGLRVPMHRLTSLDDGQNRVETIFTAWTPTLR